MKKIISQNTRINYNNRGKYHNESKRNMMWKPGDESFNSRRLSVAVGYGVHRVKLLGFMNNSNFLGPLQG
jgi:hypothetical protein